MRYIDLSVRLEMPVDATDEQIESWLLNNFNATSARMASDNPLSDSDLSARSAYDISFKRVDTE